MNKIIVSSNTGNFKGGAPRSLKFFLEYSSIPKDRFQIAIPHEGWVGSLRQELNNSGFSATIVLKHTDKTPFEKYLFSPRIWIKRLYGILRFTKLYYRLLKSHDADVVYLNTIYCLIDGVIGFLTGIPVVCHIRGIDNNIAGIRQIRILIMGLIAKKIITVSSNTKKELVEYCPMFRNKTYYIPNGIDLKSVQFEKNRVAQLRNHYKLEDKIVIGCIGLVCEHKNTLMFAQIADSLCAAYENVVFLWVGDYDSTGESAQVYKDIQERFKPIIKTNRLIFSGFKNDIYNWLELFDIFLFLSRSEGMPRSILEAMAMKKVVLSFAIDGVIDLIKDEQTGFLIPPYDVKKIIEKLENFIINGIDKEIGTAACEAVKKEFSLERTARQIDRVLFDTLKRK